MPSLRLPAVCLMIGLAAQPAWAGYFMLRAKEKDLFPRPNIGADLSRISLSLHLADSIPQELQSRTKGIKKLHVEAWRSALERGFDDGFSEASGNTPFTMNILRADLALVPGAVSGAAAVVAVSAQVTFKAQVKDASGNTVCTEAATATAKMTTSQGRAMGDLVSSTVESMYELIADRCLSNNPAPALAPAPAPVHEATAPAEAPAVEGD